MVPLSISLSFQIVPLEEVPLSGPVLVERHKPIVLVVDDERMIADTLSLILSRSGFSVLTAYDGEEALEIAKTVPPELLLTDVMMPGMDGTELAIAVTETCPACKVLLFSGSASACNLLVRARQSGHDFELLTKPIHPTDLLARIHESFQVNEPCAALA